MVRIFNSRELLFIKKYAYGVNKQEIIKDVFMGSYDTYQESKQDFRAKLDVNCDIHMIKRSYEIQLFDIDTYFLEHQQHIAFGTAYNVYMNKASNSDQCYITLKELYVRVLRSHVEIINSYRSKVQSLTG